MVRLIIHNEQKNANNDDDLLHNVIINQNIARHLQPLSLISNDSTMLAPSKRLAILERDQRDAQTMTVLENPYSLVHFTSDDKQSSSVIRSHSTNSSLTRQPQLQKLLLHTRTLPTRHHYFSPYYNSEVNNIYENNQISIKYDQEHHYAYENLTLELGELTSSTDKCIQQF
ncbi:unnamed protein product [Didymodactylos carnosus]|uniref:Uncharacterized protein n=1 Tax=Didymodactylos carnosus TaxID=1234261 RepID=A0A8S2KH19_9BILA|nr:unnamed protein product [Didymodactylos carnosus]CAF3851238.1 unnamed protein product [Didymodactylos carnosus]